MEPRARPPVRPGNPLARVLVGALVRLVRALAPERRERWAAHLAALAWALGVRRRVALENLEHAFPDWTPARRAEVARGAYRTMALAALEAVTSDLLPAAALDQAVAVADWKGLDRLLAERRPVLVASAHLGSWELFAEVMARRGFPFSAVVRPLSGAFNEWVVNNRLQAGVELILQRGALKGMLEALGRGRPVVQLIDQAVNARAAPWVRFFGRPASASPALSIAALRTGAPVYVVVALREAAGLRMYVEGPVPVPEGPPKVAAAAHTQALTDVLEGFIRRAPEQWLWLHRRWKGHPPAAEAPGSVPRAP